MAKTKVERVGGETETSDADFIIDRPKFSEGTWVSATKDFTYDSQKVGHLRWGQILQLRGYRNDAGLVDHRLLIVMEPQPKSEAVVDKHFPKCGECGRNFINEQQRDRCGELHEMTAEERKMKRRELAHETVKEHAYGGEMPTQVIGE